VACSVGRIIESPAVTMPEECALWKVVAEVFTFLMTAFTLSPEARKTERWYFTLVLGVFSAGRFKVALLYLV
jgi:hypothetical protein